MFISLGAFWKDVKRFIKKETLGFIKQDGFFKKFIFTYLVYFLGILSIIQANFLYKTDVQRVAEDVWGDGNWRHAGRFLNDLLVYIFHFDSYPRDISPLSQLIGIFFLSIASMILVYCLCKKRGYLAFFFSTVLGLSPYFLQIISYNFDCLFYSASVLFVVVPFLFYKNDRAFYLISALGLFLAYSSWQASISIYMIIVTYLFWLDFCNPKISVKSWLKKMLFTVGVFLAISFGYLIILHLFPVKGSVVAIQGGFCPLSECWAVFEKKYEESNGWLFLYSLE